MFRKYYMLSCIINQFFLFMRMCMCACMYVIPGGVVPKVVRKECGIPWNWS